MVVDSTAALTKLILATLFLSGYVSESAGAVIPSSNRPPSLFVNGRPQKYNYNEPLILANPINTVENLILPSAFIYGNRVSFVRGGAVKRKRGEEEEEDLKDDELIDEEEVEELVTKTKPKKKSKSKLLLLSSRKSPFKSIQSLPSTLFNHLPYLLRATLFAPKQAILMTSWYWKSLMNPSFPDKHTTDEISSSNNNRVISTPKFNGRGGRKTRQGGGGGGRGNRKMQCGQSKSLSDLPKLG